MRRFVISTMQLLQVACCFLLVSMLFSCSSRNSSKFSGDPVAVKTDVDGNEVVVADVHFFAESIDLPLSSIAGEIEVIHLDNRPEALFTRGQIYLSDNYIGVSTSQPVSFKLFDRKGNYLRDIGTVGRGPSEYMNIYSACIDEKAKLIYILPWQTQQLLVFGLDGSVHPPVPFPASTESSRNWSPKGQFRLNGDGTITVATLPMYNDNWGWVQDKEGNMLEKFPVKSEYGRVDFSSEITKGGTAEHFTPFLTIYANKNNDFLYRYDERKKQMVPVFTIKNIQDLEPPYYSYSEIPGYFLGSYSPGMGEPDERGNTTALPPKNFLVDKKTLQGGFYTLYVDELGNLPGGDFSNGYYIRNTAAINFKRFLETVKDKEGLDGAVKKRAADLYNSIDEEDNNILVIAKLKN